MRANKQSLKVSLLLSGFLLYSGATIAEIDPDFNPDEAIDTSKFYAHNDVANITRDPDAASSPTVTGNVLTNDNDFIDAQLLSPIIGEYGSLAYSGDGSFTYTLFNRMPEIINLDFDEYLTDSFTYQIKHSSGKTDQATLTINIFGAAGAVTDNVEIEPNNRSYLATALNSGQDIKGQLHHSDDKDWFTIKSSGNEIIHLELCPPGTPCFDKKAWVMYVFDGSRLTNNQEQATVPLQLVGDTTGQPYDTWFSNHMYLNYNMGAFDDSLIGVIDPCYGTSTALDIGVGNGNNTYYVAISSPLERDGGDGCSAGGVILEREGPERTFLGFSGGEGETTTETETTTEEYIAVFPNSDDQYQLLVARTGTDPLKGHSVPASTVNGNSFIVPELKVEDGIYSVEFNINTSGEAIMLDLKGYSYVNESLSSNSFVATFDPETNIVQVPKYVDEITQKIYSLVFLLHTDTGELELIKVSPIE